MTAELRRQHAKLVSQLVNGSGVPIHIVNPYSISAYPHMGGGGVYLEYVNLSSDERSMIDAAEKWELDQRADRYYAKKEGLAEGRAEGALNAKLANARAALRLGLSQADGAEITGLDAATVDQLADELTVPVKSV